MDIYEFKLKLLGDRRAWEEIPPHDRGRHSDQAAAASYARRLADNSGVVEVRYNLQGSPQIHNLGPMGPELPVEVRYNLQGSPQGNYVPGDMETRAAHRANLEAAKTKAAGVAIFD
jgi:hypothetical protein